MRELFLLPHAMEQDPAVAAWWDRHSGALGTVAAHWFTQIRACGADVCEILHDGHPTACVDSAAFAYVNLFKSHLNVGFFCGAELPDPQRLLQGSGKFMRHVKLTKQGDVDDRALSALILDAYQDIKFRLALPRGTSVQ